MPLVPPVTRAVRPFRLRSMSTRLAERDPRSWREVAVAFA
jgi:hypothetical protein